MQLLMFSGNSLRNRDWIAEAEREFKDLFENTSVQQYKHWSTGQSNIDLEAELQALQLRVAGMETEYGVFAKSIGTALTAQAIERGIIQPQFLLLCGLPLGYIKPSYPQFADVIAGYNRSTRVIQNELDPVGSAADAQAYMSPSQSITDYDFIASPGDTHDYLDYDLMRDLLRQLSESNGDSSESGDADWD